MWSWSAVFGTDELLGGPAAGHGGAIVVLVAFLLGLRHASDPDHLVAVSTLVAGTRGHAGRAAARLGAAWGAGHATTLLAFGLPVLALRSYLPSVVEAGAEALIGAIIVLLAVRLLVRWRRGAFHTHVHEHAGSRHAHLHSHAEAPGHGHAHLLRTPAQAFSIGLVHGAAGSGAVAVLIVAAVPGRTVAMLALFVLAAGTAVSMTLLSAVVGRVLGAAAARRLLTASIPALGSFACVFGVWYLAEALRGF
jgi:ABC-type nickel/cobalt efflux system permease component RcnA